MRAMVHTSNAHPLCHVTAMLHKQLKQSIALLIQDRVNPERWECPDQ